MPSDSRSVYGQLTRLCEKLLKERIPTSPLENRSSYAITKDLRALSYEILLNKSNSSCSSGGEDEWDAVTKIMAYSYTLHQHHMTNQAVRLHDLVGSLLNGSGDNPAMEAILLFLANLSGEVPNKFHETNGLGSTNINTMYNKSRMSLDMHVKPYPEFPPHVFEPPSIWDMQTNSTYISIGSNFPFSQEPGTGLTLIGKFGRSMSVKQKQCSFVEFPAFPELTKPRDLIIPKESFCLEQQDEGYGTPSQDNSMTVSCLTNMGMESIGTDVWQFALEMDLPSLRTWEMFGSASSHRELPFIMDAGVDSVELIWRVKMGPMQMYSNPSKASCALLKTMSWKQLTKDLKFLLVGIPSETFQYNENGDGFVMENNIYVKGISPGTLRSFCQDFIMSGTCCLRLSGLVTSSEMVLGGCPQEGLIFQALVTRVRQFLQLYHGATMLLPEDSVLLNMRQRFDSAYILMSFFGRLCKVHPNTPQGEILPEGVALLEYVYQEIFSVTRKDVACILYSVLQACCQVYFRFLQKWIFEGCCQDIYKEFFIQEKHEMMICRQREYWTQAYYLLDEAVPGFMRGIESAIYQCGKAVNLLKLCNPQDPLCIALQSGYPSVRCCLNSADLHKLEEECLVYQHRAMQLCGEPVSVSSMFQSVQEAERVLHLSVQAAQREHIHKFKLAKSLEMTQAVAKKNAQLAILKEQMELKEARREEEKRKQLEEDELQAKKAQELEKEVARLTEIEKNDMLDYYDAMMKVAEKRRQHAEWRIERMKLQDKRVELHYNNVESAASVVDRPNNEPSQDINRNISETTIDSTGGNIIETQAVDTQNNTLQEDKSGAQKTNIDVAGERISKTDTVDNENNALQENKTGDRKAEYQTDGTKAQNGAHQMDVIDIQNISLQINDMNSQYNMEFKKPRINLEMTNAKAEAERNYRRVMNSEYNILTGERWTYKRADSMKASEVKTVLESHSDQSGHSIDDEDSESFVSLETDSSQSRTVLPENSITIGDEQAEIKTSNIERKFIYMVDTPVYDSRMVNITDRVLPPAKQSDAGCIDDMSSISIALQKSILIPLKIQTNLVNSALLKLFLKHEDLISHLHSLRSYFFLLDGEFGRNVTDALFERMYQVRCPADLLNCFTLNSILSNAMTRPDPNADRLSFNVKYIPTHFTFSSPLLLDCIVLHYKVTWPLNIIITDIALQKYDEIFGFLLRLRHISWVLEEDFHYLKRGAEDRPGLLGSPQYHQVQLYRHEMTQFVCALRNYVTATVLQSSWVEFLQNLQNANTVDDLYKTHASYVKIVLFRCLLNKSANPIQKALHDTLRMILKFHGQLHSQTWQRKSTASHYCHSKFNTLKSLYESFHNMAAFTFRFANKLANTGYQPHLLDLLQMLNMNGFYPENL